MRAVLVALMLFLPLASATDPYLGYDWEIQATTTGGTTATIVVVVEDPRGERPRFDLVVPSDADVSPPGPWQVSKAVEARTYVVSRATVGAWAFALKQTESENGRESERGIWCCEWLYTASNGTTSPVWDVLRQPPDLVPSVRADGSAVTVVFDVPPSVEWVGRIGTRLSVSSFGGNRTGFSFEPPSAPHVEIAVDMQPGEARSFAVGLSTATDFAHGPGLFNETRWDGNRLGCWSVRATLDDGGTPAAVASRCLEVEGNATYGSSGRFGDLLEPDAGGRDETPRPPDRAAPSWGAFGTVAACVLAFAARRR